MASSSSAASPLLYSCIAYETTILTEHTASATTSTSSLPGVILPKISHDISTKQILTQADTHIYYIADGPTANATNGPGLTYLCIARAPLSRRIPFAFLLEAKTAFLRAYDPTNTDFSSLPAYGTAAFNARLKSLMRDAADPSRHPDSGGDAFAHVQREMDSVKGVMTQNIERVLERGERIDLLVDKTDRLGGSASDFRVRSRGLRRRMWWKNVRLMTLLVVVLLFLAYLVVGFGCGLPGTFSFLDIRSRIPTCRC